MNTEPVLINICGNIASGKSTLVAALKDRFKLPAVSEETSRISLFDFYCRSPNMWAGPAQAQFLTDKFARAISSLVEKATLVDRSFEEDALIFARMHYDLGNISDAGFDAYMRMYTGAVDLLPSRKVNILVSCSDEEQVRRIQYRSVREKRMLSDVYLDALRLRYRDFARKTNFHFTFNSENDDIADLIDFVDQTIT